MKATAKYEKYESDKKQQIKVRKRTTEGKIKAVEGSTEARRKDVNGCTELRN